MRPHRPLAYAPAGYLQLERYSSLKRFWDLTEGAERTGRRVRPVRGDAEDVCRRVIEGFALEGAGGLVDLERAAAEIEDGLSPHPALLALAAADPEPLKALLSEAYRLEISFALAFTRARDLVLKATSAYKPLEAPGPLPGLSFVPRRFSRDELRFMLHRACGLG
ncbi:hypothetical protein HNR42_001905 [Deinobacterium chartae]|uniref:Uncharacterized protein n=1 Tax=Deinobacterium chartae TaxID=521158 RepID=A0A841HY51_9DEIO|nr:hypothetical protein [Deinobacterium chartae]MBB6098471.1 hypothetical protein [Deinobacterium chartae]